MLQFSCSFRFFVRILSCSFELCAPTGAVSGKCFDDHFWYSPGCRDVPQSCLVWFTAGNGWGMSEMLVKVTVFNMPVAVVVASSFANYASVPNDLTNLMLYWWVPDPTFLRRQSDMRPDSVMTI